MDFVSGILCAVEAFLGDLFGFLNETLGEMFGFELKVPDLGCDE